MGEQRFSVIPVRAVTDKSMPASVFRTLSALGLFTDKNGWCYPSLRALSEILGVSRSRISRHIKWLAEHGYLNVVPQYNADGSRGANLIQVRFDYPPEDTSETPPGQGGEDEAPVPLVEASPEADGNGSPEPAQIPEGTPKSGDEAPATEPVGEGVLRPAQQGVSPSATGGVSPSATGVALKDATGVALKSATGVALKGATGVALKDATGVALKDATGVALKDATGVALKGATGVALKDATLTPQLTSQLTQRVKTTTTTTTTNARARPRDSAVAVVAVADDLPDEIRRALKDLGWVGSVAEISRAWAENPRRVYAWLDYARSKGWSAALLRHTLRTDPGMPPQDKRPLAGWEAFAENVADTGEPPPVTDGALSDAGQEASAPERSAAQSPPPDQIPPNVGETPPVLTILSPDMGVTPPPRASDAASVPPDVRQWWQTALGQLRYEMPKASFDTWVAPARPVKWRDGDGNGEAVLTVGVANDYARQWLEERVAKILSQYLSALAGNPVMLEVTVG